MELVLDELLGETTEGTVAVDKSIDDVESGVAEDVVDVGTVIETY